MKLSFRILFCMLSLFPLTACLSIQKVDVDAAEGFGWDEMKRHRILMTPLLDLRSSSEQSDPNLKFFTSKESIDYAESFKQKFFELRNDIRVYGAGGAFDYVSSLEGLPAMGRRVVNKEPLTDAEKDIISKGSQGIRYIFFYAITSEKVTYDVSYTYHDDRRDDIITYLTSRNFTVKMAMWDAETNRTDWIGTKKLSPTDSHSVSVENPTKRKAIKKMKDGSKKIYWVGQYLSVSLAGERRSHPDRFPSAPNRGHSLDDSFEDFTLSLPIKPDEVEMLELSYFVYHMPILAANYSTVGSSGHMGIELGTSSIIRYRYRLGGFIQIPVAGADVEFQGKNYGITETAFGVSADMEWRPTKRLRLITGALVGSSVFAIGEADKERETSTSTADSEENNDQTDGTLIFWPRVRLVFGNLAGFQWGVGAAYRYRYGIEEEILKKHQPSPWSAELFLGTAFRGF